MTDESEKGGEISIGKEIEGMIERAGEACQAGRDGGEIGSNLEREERESARVEERESRLE